MEIEAIFAGPVGKDDYYKDTSKISFSTLKTFSRCETLYRDLYVTKSYEDPEQDYFVYGKLVDAIVTEGPEFVAANFIKVERRVSPEDALRLENKVRDLMSEIEKKTAESDEKLKAKIDALIDSKKSIEEKIDPEKGPTETQKKKLSEVISKMNDLTMAPEEARDKTLQKGIESRKAEVEEITRQLEAIKALADKIQVTKALWEEAEQTAEAIKAHPHYSSLVFDQFSSQQVFIAKIDGVVRKGKLDHLKLSNAVLNLYKLHVANQLSLPDLRAKIQLLNPNDRWAIITDVKTCFSLEKLEPYSTHWRGQLGYYQDLVSAVLGIPIENIKLRILVGDKVNNKIKKMELFEYLQPDIDDLKPDVRAWIKKWDNAMKTNTFISDKAKHGMEQKCFTCSECRFCPFSNMPGAPVIVSGPRFKSNAPQSSATITNADPIDY